jgi:heptosyltransferase III
VEPRGEVVAPGIGDDPERRARFEARFDTPPACVPSQPLVVAHPFPMYRYKQWHIDGWVETIRWARARGFAIALTGGPESHEREYAAKVVAAAGEPVLNFVGELSFGETAELIRHARLFIGPDTSTTHVAAACGTPTIALFGPSDPVRWGPWPSAWPAGTEPWSLRGSGRRGNVYLLQGEGECVPCRREGCERHLESRSDCLANLGAGRVIAAASELLGISASPTIGGISVRAQPDTARPT